MSFEDTLPLLLKQLTGHVFWKDVNSIYRYCSPGLAKLLEFGSSEDAIGKSDFDIPSIQLRHAKKAVAQDQIVLSGEEITEFNLIRYSDEMLHALYVVKKPLYAEKDTSKPIGILGQAFELNKALMASLGEVLMAEYSARMQDKISKRSYPIVKNYPTTSIALSERETQTLFYLIQGVPARVIAEKLDLSQKTVEAHMQRIKLKTNADSKAELIKWAFESKLFYLIPGSLLPDLL